jgi:flagellar hook-length control protein FliK
MRNEKQAACIRSQTPLAKNQREQNGHPALTLLPLQQSLQAMLFPAAGAHVLRGDDLLSTESMVSKPEGTASESDTKNFFVVPHVGIEKEEQQQGAAQISPPLVNERSLVAEDLGEAIRSITAPSSEIPKSVNQGLRLDGSAVPSIAGSDLSATAKSFLGPAPQVTVKPGSQESTHVVSAGLIPTNGVEQEMGLLTRILETEPPVGTQLPHPSLTVLEDSSPLIFSYQSVSTDVPARMFSSAFLAGMPENSEPIVLDRLSGRPIGLGQQPVDADPAHTQTVSQVGMNPRSMEESAVSQYQRAGNLDRLFAAGEAIINIQKADPQPHTESSFQVVPSIVTPEIHPKNADRPPIESAAIFKEPLLRSEAGVFYFSDVQAEPGKASQGKSEGKVAPTNVDRLPTSLPTSVDDAIVNIHDAANHDFGLQPIPKLTRQLGVPEPALSATSSSAAPRDPDRDPLSLLSGRPSNMVRLPIGVVSLDPPDVRHLRTSSRSVEEDTSPHDDSRVPKVMTGETIAKEHAASSQQRFELPERLASASTKPIHHQATSEDHSKNPDRSEAENASGGQQLRARVEERPSTLGEGKAEPTKTRDGKREATSNSTNATDGSSIGSASREGDSLVGLHKATGSQNPQPELRDHSQLVGQPQSNATSASVTPTEKGTQKLALDAPAVSSSDMEKVISRITSEVAQRLNEGKTEIRLQLKPESLGEISLRLRLDDDKLVAQIRVTQPDVKVALEASLPQLRDALASRNINVQQIDVFAAGDAAARESRAHQDPRHKLSSRRRESDAPHERYRAARLLGYNTIEMIM